MGDELIFIYAVPHIVPLVPLSNTHSIWLIMEWSLHCTARDATASDADAGSSIVMEASAYLEKQWNPASVLTSFSPSISTFWQVPDNIWVMGENWFQREFLVRRRLAFNILFHGTHIALFALGWYFQVNQLDYLLYKSNFRHSR